ncbi:MAG: beta-lactamase family protein [Archangium sp.]|nr:beta-lactamase family protein [Archangium sp.]
MNTELLEGLLREGVTSNVFPLARLEVFHKDEHVISLGNADPTCVFDLASLSKVMSTTALVLDQQLAIESSLQRFLPTALAQVSLADLMFHRSGLPAFLPYFDEEMTSHPELREPATFPELRARIRTAVIDRVCRTAPTAANGVAAVYSDIGFILLGAVLETASGLPLDRLFATRIAAPLGLSAGYRRISSGLPLPAHLAPTQLARPREPAVGQEGMWKVSSIEGGPGQVDDDNCFVLDGVSGHAGLFGTALDVARYGQAILEERWVPTSPWGRDTLTPGSTRALGFDTPSDEGASCGQRFGRKGPRGAIGHLGFTGTALWIDFDRQLVVALLTNRVALGRANIQIRAFRPRVFDAVLDALGV